MPSQNTRLVPAPAHTFFQNLHTVSLCQVSLAAATETAAIDTILQALEQQQGGWCITINLEILRRIASAPDLRELIQGSTLRVADGITLVWASWLRGTPLPERVCGSNLIYSLTHAIAKQQRSIFLLGGNQGTAEKTAEILRQTNPGLNIVGVDCPVIDFDQTPQQIQAIGDRIRHSQPDVIYVALGFPKSERLIATLYQTCPTAWWIGVGISFSYVSGEIERAPQWAQQVGLESLYRLVQEPRRLAKRYLLVGPPFAAQLLLSSLLQRLLKH